MIHTAPNSVPEGFAEYRVRSKMEFALLSRLNRMYAYGSGSDHNFLARAAEFVDPGNYFSTFGVDAGDGGRPGHWMFVFNLRYAISFPQTRGRTGDRKMKLDRPIAIYTKGDVDSEAIQRMLRIYMKEIGMELLRMKILPIEFIRTLIKEL